MIHIHPPKKSIIKRFVDWFQLKQINFLLWFFFNERARHEINESVESLEHDFGAGMSEFSFDSARVSSSSSRD